LRQLELQREGLRDGETWELLHLNEDQRKQFMRLIMQAHQKIQPLLEHAQKTGSRKEVQGKVIKIRDDLMDVKHLQRVSEHGLELWLPVMKASFPLGESDAASVLNALNVPVPELAREQYSLPQLEDELIAPNPDLRSVGLHKSRTHYVIDDCMVEMTEMRAEGHTIRTLVVESPDQALIRATVRKLGLEGRANMNVARGLKWLVDFGPRRFAVIDIGTNSVKYHLGERTPDGASHAVADRSEVTRLGEGLDASGQLSPPAIERTVAAVAGMIDEARRDGALDIAAVGTAGLRIASNRDAFIDAVREQRGVIVEVISGEDEARLAYLAATSTLPVGDGRLVVFDSGGGSSQFTFGECGHVEERFSLDLGAVPVTERFGLDQAVNEETVAAARAEIASQLGALDGRPPLDVLAAIGGAITNLAGVQLGLERYEPGRVRGLELEAAEVDRQIELYRTRDADERRSIRGLQPKRAQVILAGACIVRSVLAKLGRDSLTVSDQGLRHGVLLERFSPS
jgi:exopolyphosphatase/guanosine-5'-triphosphate,3'-diphosphate pyrophosphatase